MLIDEFIPSVMYLLDNEIDYKTFMEKWGNLAGELCDIKKELLEKAKIPHWEESCNGTIITCSTCNYSLPLLIGIKIHVFKYCPNCGVKNHD